ncbi:hypothetical protein JCM10212_001916 [Sporobolomyces blumeae]
MSTFPSLSSLATGVYCLDFAFEGKGLRRPPFYPLCESCSQHSHGIEEIELGSYMNVRRFDSGEIPGGDEAWNDEREQILDWLYDPDSPRLVDPYEPDEHKAHLTAPAVNFPASVGRVKLLRCAKCLEVGREHFYCSIDCQTRDWKAHRSEGHCGVPLADFLEIPTIVAPARPPTDAEALRAEMLEQLEKCPDAFWVMRMAGSSTDYGTFSFDGCSDDAPRRERIRDALRQLAFRALEETYRVAIALLAYAVMSKSSSAVDRIEVVLAAAGSDVETLRPTAPTLPDEAATRQTQFRDMFELESSHAWEAVVREGKAEIEKVENAHVKDYRLAKRQEHLKAIRRLASRSETDAQGTNPR